MPTTYGNDIVYCLKSHCGVRGYCRQKWVLQVQIICKFSNERTCKRNKNLQGLSCGFEVLYELYLIACHTTQHHPSYYHKGVCALQGFFYSSVSFNVLYLVNSSILLTHHRLTAGLSTYFNIILRARDSSRNTYKQRTFRSFLYSNIYVCLRRFII